jgi:hypothetical protein
MPKNKNKLQFETFGIPIDFRGHAKQLSIVTWISGLLFLLTSAGSSYIFLKIVDIQLSYHITIIYFLVSGTFWVFLLSYVMFCLQVLARFSMINDYLLYV